MKKFLLALLASLAVVLIDYGFSQKTTYSFMCSGKSATPYLDEYLVWFRNTEREFYLDLAKDVYYHPDLYVLSRQDVEIKTGLFSGIEYSKRIVRE